jgi:hypothetical protein
METRQKPSSRFINTVGGFYVIMFTFVPVFGLIWFWARLQGQQDTSAFLTGGLCAPFVIAFGVAIGIGISYLLKKASPQS